MQLIAELATGVRPHVFLNFFGCFVNSLVLPEHWLVLQTGVTVHLVVRLLQVVFKLFEGRK